MKLMINHQTHYHYSEPASRSIQYIRMSPQSNQHQYVHSWDVSIPGSKALSKDAFDNVWMTSTQVEDYQQLVIMAQGVVEINTDNLFGIASPVAPSIFLQMTETTLCSAEMLSFAQKYVPNVSLGHLKKLAQAVLQLMPYLSESTLVTHSAIKSFNDRQGVCQDHSHVFIAMCKALGVPARYVSGYLYVTDMIHLASHAWAEVWLDGKWHCFDISNQLFQPSAHIYVAVGRDYWDVAPVRGVRTRGGIETMHSIVQVLPC